jgi:fructosamine-3-kinase
VDRSSSGSDWVAIAAQISSCTGSPFEVQRAERATGGCINEAWVLSGGGRRYFVKLAVDSESDFFEAESDGLLEMAQAGAVRVPLPVCLGHNAGRAWLVLEYLDLRAGSDREWRQLGASLAVQHRRLAPAFGWRRDNSIGSTPQPNGWSADWTAFVRDRRLGHQLRLAQRNGFGGELGERGARLLDALPAFFVAYTPQPCLLHGDLWSGNVGFLADGEPVIFDPAVYYGDREADLAMTELFGGFGADFYSEYRAAWPPDPGYATRRRLYNLYHLLNHLNLFGPGYLARCRSTIDQLLAEA